MTNDVRRSGYTHAHSTIVQSCLVDTTDVINKSVHRLRQKSHVQTVYNSKYMQNIWLAKIVLRKAVIRGVFKECLIRWIEVTIGLTR